MSTKVIIKNKTKNKVLAEITVDLKAPLLYLKKSIEQ